MRPSPLPRRRLLRRVAVALGIALPVLELLTLIGVSRLIGGWPTIGLMVLTTLIGGVMIRREGVRSWRALSEATRTGVLPERGLADAGLVMVGGLLMVLPGLITDTVGLLLILPVTRPLARVTLAYLVANKVGGPLTAPPGANDPYTSNDPYPSTDPGGPSGPPGAGGATVRGEVID